MEQLKISIVIPEKLHLSWSKVSDLCYSILYQPYIIFLSFKHLFIRFLFFFRTLKSIYWTLFLFIYIFNNVVGTENIVENTTSAETITQTFIGSEQNTKNHTSLKPEHRIADNGEFHQIFRIQSNYKEKQPGNYEENSEMDDYQIENAVKFGLNMVDELTKIKEPKWYKMGELKLCNEIIYVRI